LRARWYDTNIGGLLSKDPLEDVTNSPYSYGNANPLLYTDPSGNISVITPGIWANPQTGFGAADEATFGISTQYLNDKMPGMIDVCDGGFAIGKYGTLGVSMFMPGGGLKLGKFVKWDGQAAKVFKSSRGAMGKSARRAKGAANPNRRTYESIQKEIKSFEKRSKHSFSDIEGMLPQGRMTRIDYSHTKSTDFSKNPGRELPQIHFGGEGSPALNIDGTWKHGTGKVNLRNEEKKFLQEIGWKLPNE